MVDTLLKAREVGLPLETAANIAGAPIDLVEHWLEEGRRLRTLARRKAAMPYAEHCRALAAGWDSAIGALVMNLRTYLLEHAKRDPKTCVQVLTSYEREYLQAQHRRALELPAGLTHDRVERFVPLELAVASGGGGVRARLTRTEADGSTTTAEVTQVFDEELRDHSDEELDYYAIHGRWPDEVHTPPTLDTEAEDVAGETADPDIEAEIARLQGLNRPADAPAEADAPEAPPPPPAKKKVVIVKPPPLRKIDPHADLVELTQPEEVKTVPDPSIPGRSR